MEFGFLVVDFKVGRYNELLCKSVMLHVVAIVLLECCIFYLCCDCDSSAGV